MSSSSLVARIYQDVLSFIFGLSFFSRDGMEFSLYVSNVKEDGGGEPAAFRKLNQEHVSWDLRAVYRLVKKRED